MLTDRTMTFDLYGYCSIDPRYVDGFAKTHPEATADTLFQVGDCTPRRFGFTYAVAGNVGVIRVDGLITKYRMSWGNLITSTATRQLGRAITDAASDESLRAIILRINSPGGTLAGMDALESAIAKARKIKPVAAYIERKAAGTAYRIAAECGRVFAHPQAHVGPLGCVQLWLDRLFVGPSESDGGAYGFEPGEDTAALVEQMEALHIERLCELRTIDPASLSSLRRGHQLVAEQAEAAGLIDGVLPVDALIDRLGRGDIVEMVETSRAG